MKYLIEQGANIRAVDNEKNTALHNGIIGGHLFGIRLGFFQWKWLENDWWKCQKIFIEKKRHRVKWKE